MSEPNKALLTIRGLQKSFGGLVVTKDLDMTVYEGQIHGVIGPNGAGKTTLFNEISGYETPDGGTVSFANQDITGFPPNKICHLGIGRTFQIVKPFGNKSVLYNVAVGAFARTNHRAEAIRIAEKVVEQLGLGKRKNVLAKNLNIVERKRLELAKALATGPKMLLLDEILAGLNPSEVEESIQLIHDIRDTGITILMIEHVMQAVMALCEHVVVISYGEKIAEGTPEYVTGQPDVISAYLGEVDAS